VLGEGVILFGTKVAVVVLSFRNLWLGGGNAAVELVPPTVPMNCLFCPVALAIGHVGDVGKVLSVCGCGFQGPGQHSIQRLYV